MFAGLVKLSLGDQHSMILKQDGSVWSTGTVIGTGKSFRGTTNRFAQLIPSDATAVAAGSQYSMVLMKDGSVWTAGANLYGQLGDGSQINHATFTKVVSGSVTAIDAGAFHSMALKEDGSVWIAGSNEHGQLGDPSIEHQTTFVRLFQFASGADTHFIYRVSHFRITCYYFFVLVFC